MVLGPDPDSFTSSTVGASLESNDGDDVWFDVVSSEFSIYTKSKLSHFAYSDILYHDKLPLCHFVFPLLLDILTSILFLSSIYYTSFV